ncbi:MAG: hypothetical protein ABR567_04605 [Myxococcales bacterium]|nr:hypothetical protein [Myxococcales bacterium]
MSIRRTVIVCLALFACRRAPAGPDPYYEQASKLYQQLYASQLDDAYGDPQMDRVVALLNKVDSSSADADAAKAMLGAIQSGREQLAKQRAEREKMAAAAAASVATATVNIDPSTVLAASAASVDAGPPQDPYGSGALVSDINAQSGGCLTDYEPFTEQGTGVTGTIYRVVATQNCAGKLPGFVGQAVLVVNGRIYRRMADPNPPKPPEPAARDAGPPPQQAKARPAAPADAGEPQYDMVIPGAPQPGAQPAQPQQ